MQEEKKKRKISSQVGNIVQPDSAPVLICIESRFELLHGSRESIHAVVIFPFLNILFVCLLLYRNKLRRKEETEREKKKHLQVGTGGLILGVCAL